MFKGRNWRAFSQQLRSATAAPHSKASSISQMPLSSTSSDPSDSRSLCAIHLTSTPYLPKPTCCRFALPDSPRGQTFTPWVPPPPHHTSGTHQIFSVEVKCREGLGKTDLASLAKTKMLNPRSLPGLRAEMGERWAPHMVLHFRCIEAGIEETAQTKCLNVSHLKLWNIILFIKNVSSHAFIYLYISMLLTHRYK